VSRPDVARAAAPLAALLLAAALAAPGARAESPAGKRTAEADTHRRTTDVGDIVAAGVTGGGATPRTPSTGRCGTCHPAERVSFEKSPHAGEGVVCTSCHGGDDRSLEQRIAHGGAFIGRPSKSQALQVCSRCHADEARMRPYNLPVDQLALYQTSGHGRALAKGDTRVASCADCHGAHDILGADDPASRTFRNNVPRTCGACHGEPNLFPGEAHKGEVLAEYLGSVHARALLEGGNRQAPNCTDCHGVHGAAPPDVGDVGKVCGHCHTAERRYFGMGPHGTRLAARGFSECAACHGDHAVVPSSAAKLDSLCASCHGVGSKQESLGRQLHDEYQQAAREMDAAAALIRRADAIPIDTDDYQARLEEGRTYLREALTAAHAVQPSVVSPFTTRALGVAREIDEELGGKLDGRWWRYVGLALFWFYLGLTLVLLRLRRDRAARSG
jgi:hypothetical protein